MMKSQGKKKKNERKENIIKEKLIKIVSHNNSGQFIGDQKAVGNNVISNCSVWLNCLLCAKVEKKSSLN